MRYTNGLPGCLPGKESTCNAGDAELIPGSGGAPGKGNGNPLQYSCLGNPMDRGAWQAAVHGVAKVGHDFETKQDTCVYVTESLCWPPETNTTLSISYAPTSKEKSNAV